LNIGMNTNFINKKLCTITKHSCGRYDRAWMRCWTTPGLWPLCFLWGLIWIWLEVLSGT